MTREEPESPPESALTHTPAERGLAAARAHVVLRHAESLESARPGELLVVDREGNLVNGSGRRKQSLLVSALLGGYAVLPFVVPGSFVLNAGVSLVVGGWMLLALRRQGRLNHAAQLLANQDFAACRAALEPLRTERWAQPWVQLYLGSLEWQHGEHQLALEHFEQASLHYRRAPFLYWSFLQANALLNRVQVLTVLGRTLEAQQLFRSAEPLPRGAILLLERDTCEAALAFHCDDPSLLPDESELDARVRRCLARTRFGATLAMLAWGVGKRGDTEFEKFLLDEAVPRVEHDRTPWVWPRVHAWMERRRRELA